MVLVGRLTPGLRIPTAIISGTFQIPFRQYLVYTTMAAVLWSGFWMALGYYSGRTLLPLIRQYHSQISLASTGSLAIVGLAVLAFMAWRRLRERQKAPNRASQASPGAGQARGVGAADTAVHPGPEVA